MTTLPVTLPSIQSRELSIRGGAVYCGEYMVDPDAAFIGELIDLKTNEWIGKFSNTYVVDVTAHCNMTCKYCYYRVNNAAKDRGIPELLQEVLVSGFPDICLMGAEPTTRDDLMELITAVRTTGKSVGITTNGKRLLDLEYCRQLKAAGLTYLNYSMHFSESYKLSRRKAQVVKNLLEVELPVCQWAFTISTLEELAQTLNVIDVLLSLGVNPQQFVIRAGAAIGNCKRDSGLFMSDMAKLVLMRGALKMQDGGSNLYFGEFFYGGVNLHLVRWPTNETATAFSRTGPVFGTPLGPMLSPVMQLVSGLTQEQLNNERGLLINNSRTIHQVVQNFGAVTAVERAAWPGKVWIHCEIRDWTLSNAKECLRIWPEFLRELAHKGYREIYSAIPEGDLKLRKWQEKFGLSKLSQERDMLIFKREL